MTTDHTHRSIEAGGPATAVDHVGIAVLDADAAMAYYRDTLGMEVVGDEVADDPGVRLVYLAAGTDLIQLVQPVRPCPVQSWLDEHGEGLHHVCLRVESIPNALLEYGTDADRAPIFRGGRSRRACFLDNTPQGVLIELTESEPSPGARQSSAAAG